MNEKFLLAHFDRVSDAPDSIPSLRQFILELAVRGKLVESVSSDEPASVLLERVQIEQKSRTQKGRLRKQEPLSRVRADEMWFHIPASWSWARLGMISEVVMGQSPPGASYNNIGEGVPLINGPVEFSEGPFGKTVVNQYTTAPTNLCEEGDLLLCVRGSTTGRTNIAGARACIGRGVAAIRPLFADTYLRLFIWRQRASIIAMGRGIAFPSVSRRQIVELTVPLPPLAEQGRIVAKVDELMVLCDQMESAQREREKRRDLLAAASHHRLINGGDGSNTRGDAQFFLGTFRRLTVRVEQIELLREAILNLAVRGQLTPQNPTDEPASKLFAKILAVQQRLTTSGAMPRRSVSVSANHPEVTFSLPKNWESVTVGSVCNLVTSGSRGWAEYYSKSGPNFIRAQNIRFGRLKLDDLAKVNPPKRTEGTRTQVSVNDLLMVITGAGVTNPALMDQELGETYVSQHVALIKPADTNISRWLLLCLMAQCGARAQLLERAYGAGKPGLNLDNIRSLNVPMPPLAEQLRITAKVDELMALCDRLETQLKSSEMHSNRLLDAVLDGALNDNGVRDLSHEMTNV